jgi:hypothetical protein
MVVTARGVAERVGEVGQVAVDRPAVGNPSTAAYLGAAVGSEEVVEVGAEPVAAMAAGRFSGDSREPQVVAGVDSRSVCFRRGEAAEGGCGLFLVAGVAEHDRPPWGPVLDLRLAVGSTPFESCASPGEACQFPALDVGDPPGVVVADPFRDPLGLLDPQPGLIQPAGQQRQRRSVARPPATGPRDDQ